MELEKTLTVAAAQQRVWDLLLDPKVMAGCVPGTQSVEVISSTEYVAEVKVKMSFIAARFKVKTTIVEARSPTYLRCEGTGEDALVASAMKQTSELFLTDLGDGRTEIRIKAKADVLGRLGSFGLSVMKTKADRMWDEFGANFAAIAERGAESASLAPARPTAALDQPAGLTPAPPKLAALRSAPSAVPTPLPKPAWWQRLVGASAANHALPSEQRLATDIYVELHRPGGVIKVLWPSSAASEAARWLKDVQ